MRCFFITMLLFAWASGPLMASDLDEFKVKRKEVFEFTEKPAVTRTGDKIQIAFAAKDACDVTVAVEDAAGRIVRHLVSGVLGPNAPAPLLKDTLRQTLVWDGKDDQGVYIDDKDPLIVRVSLGLKPQFERTLFWSPKKRIGPGVRPLFAAAPEGVYVHEGGGVDHIRLFDHDGNYIRTVYPVAAGNLEKLNGLKWIEFPQDGRKLPVWHGVVQATLFTSGDNTSDNTLGKYGTAASALALNGGRLALVKRSLNRIMTDGTTGDMMLDGPKTWFPARGYEDRMGEGYPRSAAFSPDGRYIYLTGYRGSGYHSWLQGVVRMEYLGDKEPELFIGNMQERTEGTDNSHFRSPMGVACDSAGRVYVADYHNDRIQVYSPDAKHLKTIAPVAKPVNIFVHPKTGEIYVVSWMLVDRFYTSDKEQVAATVAHYGPFDNPKHIATYPLEMVNYNPTVSWNRTGGVQHEAFVDCYADPPTVWLVPGTGDTSEKLLQLRRSYSTSQYQDSPWANSHYRLYTEKDGKLAEKAVFAADVAKAVQRVSPPSSPSLDRQRMYVNPVNGDLYLAESSQFGVGKAFREILRIDASTGKAKPVTLPYTTEEIAFDLNGSIYLRTDRSISRYNFAGWREIPWDYGEEWPTPGFDGDGPTLTAALPLPGSGRPGCFHLGGFGVSPKGHVVVSCYNIKNLDITIPGAFHTQFSTGKPYQPPIYPGRVRWAEVHVWDKHGQPVMKDAIGGLPMTDGLAMDKDDNIYALVAANRVLDGKEYPLERSETLMKFKPGAARIVSSSRNVPVPVGDGAPKRAFDIARGFAGQSWVEGAEWLYGGVGFGGFNSSKGGGGCACWNARPALDLFARSFATELNRFTVAVLDTNGNLILRVGKYGNVDDGVPLVKEGGPASPRPVGGDEVAICHASYVATHTDHRLFIADYGNFRIVSVKLDYHATEKVALKDIPDQPAK